MSDHRTGRASWVVAAFAAGAAFFDVRPAVSLSLARHDREELDRRRLAAQLGIPFRRQPILGPASLAFRGSRICLMIMRTTMGSIGIDRPDDRREALRERGVGVGARDDK
jgi:hypothetical protein